MDDPANSVVKGKFLNLSGQSVGTEPLLFDAVGTKRPLLAGAVYDGTRFLAVGTLGIFNTTSRKFASCDVYGKFITPPTAAQPAPMALAAGGRTSDPVLRFNASRLMLASGDSLQVTLSGPEGTVVIEGSKDLSHWLPVQTNVISGGSLQFNLPAREPSMFYRVRQP